MASKLSVVFFLLFVCQVSVNYSIVVKVVLFVFYMKKWNNLNVFAKVCFTARIPRQSDASTETPTTTTTKTNEDAEEFNQMKLELEKMLDPDEKREFNEIIANITTAKTLDEGINGAVINSIFFLREKRIYSVFISLAQVNQFWHAGIFKTY